MATLTEYALITVGVSTGCLLALLSPWARLKGWEKVREDAPSTQPVPDAKRLGRIEK